MSGVVYDQIPSVLEVPGTYVEIQEAQQAPFLYPYPSRVLILAQKLAAGIAAQNKLYTNITQVSAATSLAGAGSMGEAIVRLALAQNISIPIDLVLINDPTGGTAAAGGFAFGATIAPGTVVFYAAGMRIPVNIASTDTMANFVANSIAAINATQYIQGVASSATAGTITFTANHKGVCGNDINLAVCMLPGEQLPPGMTCTITAMTGGVGSVQIGPMLAAATNWYTDVGMPFQDSANLQTLATWLENNSNAMVNLDGTAYAVLTGSYSTIMTNAPNTFTQFIAQLGITNPTSTPWETVGAMTMVAANSKVSDPSRQLRGLTLQGIVSPWPASQFAPFPTQELLLQAGVATYQINADGTFALSRLVTANVVNEEGAADPTWHDIMTVWTAARIRYDWRVYRDNLYQQPKLFPDGSLGALNDPNAVTPSQMKGSWAGRSTYYEKLGWTVNSAQTIAQSSFTINANDHNRLDGVMPVQISGNLMVLASVLQVSN